MFKRLILHIITAALLTGCAAVHDTDEESTAPVEYAGTVECAHYTLSYPADLEFHLLDGAKETLLDSVTYSNEDTGNETAVSCILSADELYILTFSGAQTYDTPFRMALQNAQCFLGDVHSCTFLGTDGWYSEYKMGGITGPPCRMVFIEKDGLTFAAQIVADSADHIESFMQKTNTVKIEIKQDTTS